LRRPQSRQACHHLFLQGIYKQEDHHSAAIEASPPVMGTRSVMLDEWCRISAESQSLTYNIHSNHRISGGKSQ
jgi:hypothetical protein